MERLSKEFYKKQLEKDVCMQTKEKPEIGSQLNDHLNRHKRKYLIEDTNNLIETFLKSNRGHKVLAEVLMKLIRERSIIIKWKKTLFGYQ